MPGNFTNFKEYFSKINFKKLSWIIAIEIAIVMTTATFFLQGGDDIYRYYLPFAKGCLDCGFTPYYSYWLLWPLQFIPTNLVWPVWTAVTLAGLLLLCRYTGTNPALLLLSFPIFGQVWLGQIDILVCLGLTLALLGKNPLTRGVGFTLAMIKPQYAAIAVLFLLTRERHLIKTLIVPAFVFMLSLVVFGFNWPIEWIRHSVTNLPPHVWRLAAKDIWPVGVLLLWLPFLFKDRRERFEAGTIISVLASPVVGVYSYGIFLLFTLRNWWVVPLSYAWLLAYPFLSESALRFAWILPVVLLLKMVYDQYKTDLQTTGLRGLFSREKTGGQSGQLSKISTTLAKKPSAEAPSKMR